MDFEKLNEAFTGFVNRSNEALARQAEQIDEIEAKVNRQSIAGLGMAGPVAKGDPKRCFVNVAGRMIPILAQSERLTDHFPRQSDGGFSIADYVRASLGLEVKATVTSGPATVPTSVGAEIIDAVRAASTVVEAGAGTITVDGPSNIARIATDPTVYAHTEGIEDIQESDLVLEPVALNPGALVAAVPLSMEIVADSPNLDQALQTSLAAAFAAKLDALCLAMILADAAIPKSLAAHDPKTWTGTLLAIAAAMTANQRIPLAMINNSADFITRSGLLASTAGSWLGKPPILENMAELPTTKLAAGTGIFGDFAGAFAIAVRQGLRLEVIRFGKHKSATHILVAHARMAGVVLQPKKLFIQKLVP